MHYRSKPAFPDKDLPLRIPKLTLVLLRAQPIHSPPCKPFKGLHGYLQIFDPGIFRFVVTKAAERLSEHHYRRNSRSGNLRRVM